MKLTLKQKIAVGFYKTRFKTIALMSKQKAAESLFNLFCTPYSGKPKRKAPPAFHHAKSVSVIVEGLTIRGWHFTPTKSNGKKILIVHGFDSYCYKYEKYVLKLQHCGFEVLAFDAPAHGVSDGKKLNALLYKNTLLEINKQYGILYGIMAHSVGGLAATLAAEELPQLQKLVLIAPATETITAVDNFIHFLGLNNEMKNLLVNYIEQFAKLPLNYFSAARAVENIKSKIFWLHDEDDKICPIKDVAPVIAKHLPHIHFSITKGLGHNKIYRDEKVAESIISFFETN